ncbi:MAG: transposase [Gemmatimonadota bacterium]|nr:MAG: transposase [Gemmatimonadota bacterium]
MRDRLPHAGEANLGWQRVACVDADAAEDVVAAIEDAGLRCGVCCLRIAVLADHVHLQVSYRPTTRICDFVRLCKAGSSYLAGRRVPGAIRWARGYYAASVGSRELCRMHEYISRQFERPPQSCAQEPRSRRSEPTPGGSPG